MAIPNHTNFITNIASRRDMTRFQTIGAISDHEISAYTFWQRASNINGSTWIQGKVRNSPLKCTCTCSLSTVHQEWAAIFPQFHVISFFERQLRFHLIIHFHGQAFKVDGDWIFVSSLLFVIPMHWRPLFETGLMIVNTVCANEQNWYWCHHQRNVSLVFPQFRCHGGTSKVWLLNYVSRWWLSFRSKQQVMYWCYRLSTENQV